MIEKTKEPRYHYASILIRRPYGPPEDPARAFIRWVEQDTEDGLRALHEYFDRELKEMFKDGQAK